MLDNVGLRYPHRASGAKAPRTLRPLPLLRFAVSATGGAHLCSIQYYLRFWLGICRTSLAVSALRILRYCLNLTAGCKNGHPPPCRAASLRCCYSFYYIICFARVNGYFDDYYAGISSLLFTLFLCRFSFPSFFTSSRHSRSPAFILTHYPKVYLKSKNAGYFHFSATPQQKSSGQQSASRCLPYYNSASGCSTLLHLNYSSLSSGISSSKASIQLSLCHLSFSPFSLAATFCRCAWSFIMVPIGFSARSSIMW